MSTFSTAAVKFKLWSEVSTLKSEDVSLHSSATDISSGLLDGLPLAKYVLPSVLLPLLDHLE